MHRRDRLRGGRSRNPSGETIKRPTVIIDRKPRRLHIVLTTEGDKKVVTVSVRYLLPELIGQRGRKARVYFWDAKAVDIIKQVKAQLAKSFPGHEIICKVE